MLTAADSVDERVAGLNLGADDYLSKPFAFAEVVARLHALQRHGGPRARRCCAARASSSTRPARRSRATAGRSR